MTSRATVLVIVAAAFFSVVSVWNASSWLSSYNRDLPRNESIAAAASSSSSSSIAKSSVVAEPKTSTTLQQQISSKTIIDRNKTSTLGLHVCTCLTDDYHPTNANNLRHNNPTRLRWLHFPKTGTSFISTLWSYSCSTRKRYIDLNVNSQVCSAGSALSMYDFVLMRRYPWEMYGAPNFIPDTSSSSSSSSSVLPKGKDVTLGLVGGTQHGPLSPNLKDPNFLQSDRYKKLVNKNQLMRYGSELMTHNMTVAAFFRQPEERIISAYKDAYHANGFAGPEFKDFVTKVRGSKNGLCKIGNRSYTNPVQCFANYPGIAGCMARMLTGQKCADSLFHEAGLENVAEAVDIILNHLEFVGLTDDWNESICQFHRLFSGRRSGNSVTGQQRVWKQPLQREFANVHKSKDATIGVEELDGFKDIADTVVYEAAKLKFERIVGDKRCYKFMSWDEIERDINNDNANHPFLNVDKDGNVCHPLTCSALEKQCGEWDDGCGSTVICGMCDAGRSGLPSTWRVQCVEGKCVDYCPTWEEEGLWFLSNESPAIIKKVSESIATREQKYLSPMEAFKICDDACRGKAGNASAKDGIEAFVDTNLCQCGNTAKVFKNITFSDFSAAHDMMTTCGLSKLLRSLKALHKTDTQPICCPSRDEATLLQGGGQWKRLFPMGGPKLEGSYFAHIPMGCGGLDECQEVAREKGAEIAIFDFINSYCHLAKNAFELDNLFSVTKDNSRRYILDLRNPTNS